mmetsp:Transcript_27513/g.50092  ORF Transcript_27513/g.50092 Transcript_27513/m.50092 type:complete len:94 (+) Transcript_27513:473-754(+)
MGSKQIEAMRTKVDGITWLLKSVRCQWGKARCNNTFQESSDFSQLDSSRLHSLSTIPLIHIAFIFLFRPVCGHNISVLSSLLSKCKKKHMICL